MTPVQGLAPDPDDRPTIVVTDPRAFGRDGRIHVGFDLRCWLIDPCYALSETLNAIHRGELSDREREARTRWKRLRERARADAGVEAAR